MTPAAVALALGFVALAALSAWALRRWLAARLRGLEAQLGKALDWRLLNLQRQVQSLLTLDRLLRLDLGLPPLDDWAASPDFLLACVREVVQHRPAVVVECGSGASTVALARALQLNGVGHLYSLDHDETFARRTRRELEARGLGGWASVLSAPLMEQDVGEPLPWYDIAALPDLPINLLIVDGPPGVIHPRIRYPAGPLLLPRMAPGGRVLVDDIDRPAERAMLARWREDFALHDLDLSPASACFAGFALDPNRTPPAAAR